MILVAAVGVCDRGHSHPFPISALREGLWAEPVCRIRQKLVGPQWFGPLIPKPKWGGSENWAEGFTAMGSAQDVS